jgi:cytochrome c556
MRASALLVAVAVASMVLGMSAVAAPPEAPKVSTFAPAEDLIKQVDRYVEDLEKAVENQADFDEAKVAKLSNTLMLMAIGLGVHDSDNAYKANAGAIFKAAEELAKAKGFAAAKTGVDAVKAAVGGKGAAGGQVNWAQGSAVNLDSVFKQSQTVVNSLKRYTKGERFKKSVKETAGQSAVLAVIGQGVMANTASAKGKDADWFKFSAEMRDAAAEANKAIHAGEESATQAAVKKLNKSCEDCHAVFHTEQK